MEGLVTAAGWDHDVDAAFDRVSTVGTGLGYQVSVSEDGSDLMLVTADPRFILGVQVLPDGEVRLEGVTPCVDGPAR